MTLRLIVTNKPMVAVLDKRDKTVSNVNSNPTREDIINKLIELLWHLHV